MPRRVLGSGRLLTPAFCVPAPRQDHYENVYVVLQGAKTFTLLPPPAIAGLGERQYRGARHRYDAAARRWAIDLEPEGSPLVGLTSDSPPSPARAPAATTTHPACPCLPHSSGRFCDRT